MAQNISSTTPNNGTAFINGHIYTVNASCPWASGFIVSPSGIFTHVGNTDEILAEAQKQHLVVVNLRGRFTMPGIHDAHMHLLYSGLGLTSEADIGMSTTHADIAQKVKEGSCACQYVNAYQDWVLASAYNSQGFPDMKADRQYLDSLFPSQPVVVRGGGGHSMLLNTAALKLAGYDIQNEQDTPGALFGRREDGSLTGELAEMAMLKATLAITFPSQELIKRSLKHAIRVAHRAGVTSLQEASSNTLLLHALSEIEEEGGLSMDIHTHIVYGPEWVAHEKKESLHRLIDAAESFKSKHVNTRFVKIILDGVPLPPLFTQCGLDEHGHPDRKKIQVEDVLEAVQKYDERGMTVKIHCAGQGAARMALDAIESARRNNPSGPRHEIAHCSGVHEDDYSRFASLAVTAEMSPAMFFTHPVTAASGGLMHWDFVKMLDSNAHMTIGSDWGAAPDPSLFAPCAGIVETVGRGSKESGGELLVRMLTIQGAEAVERGNEIGSIEVGKRANFIVVDKDLSKGEFEGAKVLQTYFEGEEVWNAEV